MQKSKPPNLVIEYTDWTKFLPWLTQFAFVLAIAMVGGRGMLLETLRDPFDQMGGTTAAPRTCGPAGSVVLDLLCCVPALLVLLRRTLDKTYIIRLSWATASLSVFAIWAALSTFWAGDKFQTLILSSHLIAAASMFWAMSQLVRSWMRLRLVAGLCLGLLLIYIAQGLMFKFIDIPETAKYWQEHRAEEMRSRGWQEGDYSLRQYEQKLLHGDMIGFHASPNTFAATIVLLGVVTLGAGLQRMVNKDEPGLIAITLLPLPLALWIIYFTHSNTAFATPVIAGGILLLVSRFSGMLNRKRNVVFAACALAVLLGTLALIGHGMFHGTLPTASLNFRWRYWVASMHVFSAHPFLGVGYGNFGYWYLGARLPAAAEEIKDPHNMVVRAMTELGIIGAALLVGWLARIWWEWTQPVLPISNQKPAKTEYGPRMMFVTIVSLTALAVLVKVLAAIDLSADAGWVSYELLKHLVYAALLLIGFAIVAVVSTKDASLDNRPSPWLLYSMLAGLGVFLIHNTIDFSLFEIGPMLLFMTVGGAALGVRSRWLVGVKQRSPIEIGAFGTLLIAWLLAAIFLAVPLIDAENRAHEGDDAYRKQNYRLAAEHYTAAFGNSPVKNADYAMRAARSLMAFADTDGLIRARLSEAISASPQDALGYLMRARYMAVRHADAQTDIRRDFETALKLNPNDLDTRVEYAKLLEAFGDRPAAAEQYRAAMKTNDGFDAAEPKRFSEVQLKEINGKLAALGA